MYISCIDTGVPYFPLIICFGYSFKILPQVLMGLLNIDYCLAVAIGSS